MKKLIFIFFLSLFPLLPIQAATCLTDLDCQNSGDQEYYCKFPEFGDTTAGECSQKENSLACQSDSDCLTGKNCFNGLCKFQGGAACPTDQNDCVSGKCALGNTIFGIAQTCTCAGSEHCSTGNYCGLDKSCHAKLKIGEACTNLAEKACQTEFCKIKPGETTGVCAEYEAKQNKYTPETQYTAKFQLQVDIPGMDPFPDVPIKTGESGSIPWLAQYISGIYEYAIALGSLIAVIFLIVGGVKYLLAGTNISKNVEAKETIIGSILGLIIFISAYLILKLINPALTSLNPIEIQAVEATDTSEWANESFGTDSESAVSTSVQPGKWRSILTGKETCGNSDGLNLSTMPEKINRLQNIVKIWKQLSYDEGGALYIRGNDPNCDPNQSFSQVNYQLVSLSGLLKTYPEAFPAEYVGTNCYKVMETYSKLKKGQAKPNVESLLQQYNLPTKNPQECKPLILTAYQKFILPKAAQSGLLCSDCIGYVYNLYACFDNKTANRIYAGRDCTTGGKIKNYVAQYSAEELKNDAKINELLAKLQFGDVIHLKLKTGGHALLYTGKAGLDFEILEMGGGGWGDVNNNSKGSILATANIGIPKWKTSGVEISHSAATYLKDTLRKLQYLCVARPMENSFYAQ